MLHWVRVSLVIISSNVAIPYSCVQSGRPLKPCIESSILREGGVTVVTVSI